MDEVTNPYRPGAGTRPPALIGRDALINRFGVTMRRTLAGRPGKSVLPIGLRGVGKTVLLNRFAEIAENEGFRVAFIEAPEDADLPALLTTKLRTILLRLQRSTASRQVQRALGVLRGFTATYTDQSGMGIEVQPLAGIGDSGVLADDLTDLLVEVGKAAADLQLGVMIVVDELQYLTSEELGALITAVHRTTQLDLPVILVGAGLPQLPGLSGEAKSYAERLFDFPPIGSLSDNDASDAVSIPAQEYGVIFERAALRRIVRLSHGYPYFLQEWGYHAWNQADESPITLSDVELAGPAVERQLDESFFSVRFDRLTPKEKEYLRAMAELGPGPHRSGDVAAELGVKVESVGPRRSGLITKGMIYSPAHGDTAFTVPLFDEYLRRAMPEWHSRSQSPG